MGSACSHDSFARSCLCGTQDPGADQSTLGSAGATGRQTISDRWRCERGRLQWGSVSAENGEPIFRNPYNVVLAVPDRMAAAFVALHDPVYTGHAADPCRLKGVGFPDPLSGTLKLRRRWPLPCLQFCSPVPTR